MKAQELIANKQIYAEAHTAGMQALNACRPTPMTVVQHENPMDDSSPVKRAWNVPQGCCGFAWVNVKPATQAFARYAKMLNLGYRDSYYGGYTIWIHEGNQSVELKEAYARAFAEVLKNHGIQCSVGSRLD